MTRFEVYVSAPFGPCDVNVEVEYDGGSTKVEIRGGQFAGDLPGPARRLRFVDEVVQPDLAAASSEVPNAMPVDVDQLFGAGIPVPADGVLRLLLLWGTPCHQPVQLAEGRRFGSYEHQLTALAVGLDGNRAGGEQKPLIIDGAVMPINSETRIAVGSHRLRFGDIIALAGDYYAHFDASAAAELAWAWPELAGFAGWLAGRDYRVPTLADAPADDATTVLEIIARDKDVDHGALGEACTIIKDSVVGSYPARRYLALASQNFCHFGNTALRLYLAYHERAVAQARAARDDGRALLDALACDAFGCHFLTDLFASGHMRVPRRELGADYGILIGALKKANAMHGEDNRLGLWVAARGSLSGTRQVWRAYGDGMLRSDEAKPHLRQVTEAVRRSAAEVFAASRGRTVAVEDRAEWLIPQPLVAGETPGAIDDIIDGSPPLTTPNHYPMYWLTNGKLAERIGGPMTSRYRYKLGRFDTEIDFGAPRRPLKSLGSYEVASPDEPASAVAGRLVETGASYLAVQKGERWHVIDVDDRLADRLASDTKLGDTLEPWTASDRTGRPKTLLGAPKIPKSADSSKRQVLVDSVGSVSAVVGDAALPSHEVALYPSLHANKSSVVPDDTVEFALELLGDAPDGVAVEIAASFAAGAQTIEIHANVSSDAFTRPEGEWWTTTFVVARDLSTTPRTWNFKALANGSRERYRLSVRFSVRGQPLGGITTTLPRTGSTFVQVTVSPGPLMPPTNNIGRVLLLTIAQEGPLLRLQASDGDQILVPAAPWKVNSDNGYFRALQAATDRTAVEDLGGSVQLDLPPEIQALLARTETHPIVIAGDAPYAPFEVAFSKQGFLGSRRPVLRWFANKALPSASHIDIKKLLCIHPPSPDLPSAQREADYLAGRFPSKIVPADTKPELRRQLSDSTIRAVHFAGHAQNAPTPQLSLKDGPAAPSLFQPTSALMEAGPFVFLNGCDAGAGRTGVTADGNMARWFVMAGAYGFVAPAIEVLSEAGADLVAAFYDHVHSGKTIGETMRLLREAALDKPPMQIASYFSYLAFAAPDLQLAW